MLLARAGRGEEAIEQLSGELSRFVSQVQMLLKNAFGVKDLEVAIPAGIHS